jgi:N-dimethylarginine dimethylaminohydrolase
MAVFNEYSLLTQVAIRSPLNSFLTDEKLSNEWQDLRFHSKPELKESINEFIEFRKLLLNDEIKIIDLPQAKGLTIDSIYTRDSILISPKGLILCNMGRASRTPEARDNYEHLKLQGYQIAGEILAPGTLEGGDFIWLSDTKAAVGLGPRTNKNGIDQLRKILGNSVQIIDSGSAVAKQTKRVLNSHKILQTNVKKKIVHQFYSNKNIETLTNLLNRTEVEIMEIEF